MYSNIYLQFIDTLCVRNQYTSLLNVNISFKSFFYTFLQGEKGLKGDRGITLVNGKEIAAGLIEGLPGPPGLYQFLCPLHFYDLLLYKKKEFLF